MSTGIGFQTPTNQGCPRLRRVFQPTIRLIASARVAGLRSCAADRGGDGLGAGLADAAHGHAEVLALDHHDHAARLEDARPGLGDLGGQPFLDLRSFGVQVDQPGELLQPGDPAVPAGDVADVGDPGERAPGGARSRLQTSMSLTSTISSWPRSKVVASTSSGSCRSPANISRVRAGHPGRGVPQALAVRVLADRDQQLADGGRGPRLVELGDASRHRAHGIRRRVPRPAAGSRRARSRRSARRRPSVRRMPAAAPQ